MARPSTKGLLSAVVVGLHLEHFDDSAIAKVCHCSRVHVRRILKDAGMNRSWSKVEDIIAVMPEDVRADFDALMSLAPNGRKLAA